MKALFAAVALAFAAYVGAAHADPAPAEPWVQAQALLDAAMPDINRNGIHGMAGHVEAFEQALTAADAPFQDPAHPDRVVLLVDGQQDLAAAQAFAAHAFPGKQVAFVADPYAPMAFFLGCYYNEVHRFDDALRVFLAQKARTTGTFGDHAAMLTSERAVALVGLHRLDEAMAAYDEGLALANIDDRGRARMQRGRGYVFTEQNRLDDAETAYRESLRLEPGNQVALSEMQYIARLRAGGERQPGQIISQERQQQNQQQNQQQGQQPAQPDTSQDQPPPSKH